MAQISKRMIEALIQVISQYDACVFREFENWGAESMMGVAEKGVYVDMPIRTRDALIDRGLVEIGARHTSEHHDLRRGSFGQWIGGSVIRTEGYVRLRPTISGREVIRGRSARK